MVTGILAYTKNALERYLRQDRFVYFSLIGTFAR